MNTSLTSFSCSLISKEIFFSFSFSFSQAATSFFHILAYIIIFWWCFVICISSYGVIISFFRYGRSSIDSTLLFSSFNSLPPVTILRPLKGLDFDLERNLESGFKLNYPPNLLQLIFLVAHPNDSAVPFVTSLISKYPHISSTLIVSEEIVGVNPKINNLIKGYRIAKHNLIWIWDSNIEMGPESLIRSVLALTTDPTVGLVHHLPVALPPTSFGSLLEWIFLNMSHAKLYLGINGFGQTSCVIGKSTFFRKADLEQCGGLKLFGKYLAEDNMIGTAIWNMRLHHKMTGDIAHQSLGQMTLSDHFSRRLRWTRIRCYTLPYTTFLEPLSECFLLGFIFSLSTYFNFNIPILFSLLLHLFIWVLLDITILFQICPHDRPPLWKICLAWLVREFSALPLYVVALSGNTVSWRDENYQIMFGGTVRKIH
ncbi:hypothetical protein HMI56_000777 [Coelomomyces lativittatus]|nr:hypothetical protein HMI56_000777 [Coelomomyces lativittatus]